MQSVWQHMHHSYGQCMSACGHLPGMAERAANIMTMGTAQQISITVLTYRLCKLGNQGCAYGVANEEGYVGHLCSPGMATVQVPL